MGEMYWKWITVEEGLPEDPEVEVGSLIDIEMNLDELDEYIVTLKGAKIATVMHYLGNGEWWDVISQQIYYPIAWMRMPEAYKNDKKREKGYRDENCTD